MSDLVARLRERAKNAHWKDHDCMCEAADDIERLRAQVAELERDAGRYRWLRGEFFGADFHYGDFPPQCVILFRWPVYAQIGANLDAAIDKARGMTDKMRERFDVWCESRAASEILREHGGYLIAWRAWQAAYAEACEECARACEHEASMHNEPSEFSHGAESGAEACAAACRAVGGAE